MRTTHWTDDELIAHLYGVGPQDQHLVTCRDCSARLDALAHARRTLPQPQFEPAFYVRQRERIWQRVSQPAPLWNWRLASATALIAVFRLTLYRIELPVRTHPNPLVNAADASLHSDVSSAMEFAVPSLGGSLSDTMEVDQ